MNSAVQKSSFLLVVFSILAGTLLSACMRAEKISLDTSGAQGFLLAGIDLGLLEVGGGTAGSYSGAQFVAVGGSTTTECNAWYSYDGLNWTWSTVSQFPGCTGKGSLNAIAFGNGRWVAVGEPDGAGCAIWTSSDGIQWTTGTCPTNAPTQNAVAYGNGEFVSGGACYDADGDSSLESNLMKSADGVNWTAAKAGPCPTAATVRSLVYSPSHGGFLAAVDTGGSRILYDVTSNTAKAGPAILSYALSVDGDGSALAFDNTSGSGFLKKYNSVGNTWSTHSFSTTGSVAAYGNGKYRLVGSSGSYMDSPAFTSPWAIGAYVAPYASLATSWTGIVYHNGRLVLVGTTLDNGSTDFYSTADEWSTSSLSSFTLKPVNGIAAAK